MRLTGFSDYALRVLIFIANQDDRLVTIAELQGLYALSQGHLMKVVRRLTSEGYLEAVRGRNGGLRLGRRADHINLGEVVRKTEPDFRIVECFGPDNGCLISEHCKLPKPLNDALNAFLSVLDQYSIADVMLADHQFTLTKTTSFPQRGPAIEPA